MSVTSNSVAARNPALTALYETSGAVQYQISMEEFATIMAEVCAKYSPGATDEQALEFYGGLRVEELVLARACVAGHEKAWEVFLGRYRAKLYEAAYGIARDESTGRELADSLYGDLYGTNLREGQRVSKLRFYMGRGSLEGWLRTVLAQEYVNRYRTRKRLVSLDEQSEEGVQFEAPVAAPQPGPDRRLDEATDAALAALAADDRLLLATYYLDGRTLAEIARMLGVHESTISRRLEKVTKQVRGNILKELQRRGTSRRQAQEALEADVRDLTVDVRGRLAQGAGNGPFLK
jgi:RNA polymerase sigma-70 factor (ECF subfamily)